MRAAILNGPESVRIGDIPVPAPGDREVRIKLEGCGVCASNLPVWEGRPWFDYPREAGSPGHEGWGRVDAVGGMVDTAMLGERVAFLSGHAYAEYDIAGVDSIIPLPKPLERKPFPGEPLGCAFNIFRRSGIEPGQTVAVAGAGFLGLLLIHMAHRAGARVIALSRRAFSLDRARKFGADETVPLDGSRESIHAVEKLTGDALCDVVIEAAGQQQTLDLAGEITRIRGRIVIAGYHQDGLRQVNMQLWNWRGIDVINAHERDLRVYMQGMREAAASVAAGDLDPGSLYTHSFRLDDLPEAFTLLRDRPDGFIKALVIP